MPQSITPISMSGFRQREQNAKERRDANKVDPEVREARAALLARREAAFEAEHEAERKKYTRPAEVVRELAQTAPDGLLEEFVSYLPSLATRQMIDVIKETLAERRRARHAADIAASSMTARKPAKAS